MHVRCCYTCSVRVILHRKCPVSVCDACAIGLDKKGSPDHRAISLPVLPPLDLPASVSLALFENESSGPSGPVPTFNNGRISTASGLAISCSLQSVRG